MDHLQKFFDGFEISRAPALLIIVGLLLIVLGLVGGIGPYRLRDKQGPLAIFCGFFLLFIGLTLGLWSKPSYEPGRILPGRGYSDYSAGDYPIPEKEKCKSKCMEKESCIAIVFAYDIDPGKNNCFLKSQVPHNIGESPNSDVIIIRKKAE